MEYYNFLTEKDCQNKIDAINIDLNIPESANSNVKTYCSVISHDLGFAIPKNDITSKYCEGVEVVSNINRLAEENDLENEVVIV